MSTSIRTFEGRRPGFAFASAIVLLNVGLVWYASIRHCATIDESRLIPAGIAHWDSAAFAYASDSPPLARLIAALPLLPLNPTRSLAADASKERPYKSDAKLARDFANTNSLNYENLVRLARLPTLIWWALGAWLIARWAYELRGPRASLFALTLWCFSPNILAREALATPDVPACVSCLMATYAFSRWLVHSTYSRAVAVGTLLGVALLTDFAALSLLLVWPISLWVQRLKVGYELRSTCRGSQAAQILLGFVICVWTVNAGYGFSGTGTRLGELEFSSRHLGGAEDADGPLTPEDSRDGRNRLRGTWLERLPILLPSDYLHGIDRRLQDAELRNGLSDEDPRRSTDRGGVSASLLLAKIPLPIMVMIFWALALFALYGRSSPDWSVWIPSVGITVSAFSPVGILFSLPSMIIAAPFAIIGVSRLAGFMELKSCKTGVAVALLASTVVAGTLASSLNLLSYTNAAVLGLDDIALEAKLPAGDAGRDFSQLKGWLDDHPGASPVGLACQYLVDPRSLGIEYDRVPVGPQSPPPLDPWYAERVGPRPGFFALDAYNLALAKYRYFAQFDPVFTAGGTIRVFHVTDAQADACRRTIGLADKNSLSELKGWLDDHPGASPVGLACQYLVDPRSLGIEYDRVPVGPQSPPPLDPWYAERVGPRPGFFALDAYNLALAKYRYFAQFDPVFTAGGTIRVFHVTDAQADACRRTIGLPLLQKLNPDQRSAKGRGFLRLAHRDADGGVMNYTLFVPHDYRPDMAYPLILFLHGYGDRGVDGEQYLKVGFPAAIARRAKSFDFFSLIPQGREGAWSSEGEDTRSVLKILDNTVGDYNINIKRVYLTGLSSGGASVWTLAARVPGRWAAIAPVASAECDPRLAHELKDIPCWCFHNYFDVSKSPVIPRRMIEAIRQAGGRPRYTEFYETTGDRHNAWDGAYNLNELYDWLAEQIKN